MGPFPLWPAPGRRWPRRVARATSRCSRVGCLFCCLWLHPRSGGAPRRPSHALGLCQACWRRSRGTKGTASGSCTAQGAGRRWCRCRRWRRCRGGRGHSWWRWRRSYTHLHDTDRCQEGGQHRSCGCNDCVGDHCGDRGRFVSTPGSCQHSHRAADGCRSTACTPRATAAEHSACC